MLLVNVVLMDQYLVVADCIGGSICGSFIIFGGLSVLLYKPWRRRFDEKRRMRQRQRNLDEALGEHDPSVELGESPDREIVLGDHPDDSQPDRQFAGNPRSEIDTAVARHDTPDNHSHDNKDSP